MSYIIFDTAINGWSDNSLPITLQMDNCTSVQENAFFNKGYTFNLTDLLLPPTLTTIGENAFRDAIGITGTADLSNITSIGSNAFDSSGLTKLLLSPTLTSIGSYAFDNCSRLTALSLPNSLITIKDGAFRVCTGLTGTLDLSKSSLQSIGRYAFQNCRFTELLLPPSLTTLQDGAFRGCSGLKFVDLSNLTTLTTLSNEVFQNCTTMKSITFPSSLTSIGIISFQNCGLTGCLDLSKTKVHTIHNFSFLSCNNLTSVSFPPTLKTIGRSSFSECNGLSDIYFRNNCVLQTNAFPISNATVYAYAGSSIQIYNSMKASFSTTNNPLSVFFQTWRLYDYPYPYPQSRFGKESTFTLTYTPGVDVHFYTYSVEPEKEHIVTTEGGTYSDFSYTYSNHVVTFTIKIHNATTLTLNGHVMNLNALPNPVMPASKLLANLLPKASQPSAKPVPKASHPTIRPVPKLIPKTVIPKEITPKTVEPPLAPVRPAVLPRQKVTPKQIPVSTIRPVPKLIPAEMKPKEMAPKEVTPNDTPLIISDICFIKGTLVKTDQETLSIELITNQTLNQKPITLTKTIHYEPYLVKVSAYALGDYPIRDTYMSLKHRILLDVPIMARDLINGDTITQVPYDGEPLYNILIENHAAMWVHGMLVETLDPNSIVGLFHRAKLSPKQRTKMINMINEEPERAKSLLTISVS